jgi:hypothetical protein
MDCYSTSKTYKNHLKAIYFVEWGAEVVARGPINGPLLIKLKRFVWAGMWLVWVWAHQLVFRTDRSGSLMGRDKLAFLRAKIVIPDDVSFKSNLFGGVFYINYNFKNTYLIKKII